MKDTIWVTRKVNDAAGTIRESQILPFGDQEKMGRRERLTQSNRNTLLVGIPAWTGAWTGAREIPGSCVRLEHVT